MWHTVPMNPHSGTNISFAVGLRQWAERLNGTTEATSSAIFMAGRR